jgi:hypothetical protein
MVQAARIEHDIDGRRCLVVDDVALAKLDLDAGLLGTRPGGSEGGRNEVDRDDGEALLREVHGVDALAAANVERASACSPLRDRALQERRRLLAMPRQGLDTRCAPVKPCEHRPLEIHASAPPGIAPSCCILLSLPGRHAARKSTIAQTLDDGAVPEPALHSPRRHSDRTRGQSAGSG